MGVVKLSCNSDGFRFEWTAGTTTIWIFDTSVGSEQDGPFLGIDAVLEGVAKRPEFSQENLAKIAKDQDEDFLTDRWLANHYVQNN